MTGDLDRNAHRQSHREGRRPDGHTSGNGVYAPLGKVAAPFPLLPSAAVGIFGMGAAFWVGATACSFGFGTPGQCGTPEFGDLVLVHPTTASSERSVTWL
jgi:hypothetical protein